MSKTSKPKKTTVSFYKKRKCWYAEVPEYTEAQNLMVSGADDMCEALAQGHKRVTVEFAYGETDPLASGKKPLASLDKIGQSPYGATYAIYGVSDALQGCSMPREIWLCNVTKTVCGGRHPNYIDITRIEPNDGKPYGGKRTAGK